MQEQLHLHHLQTAEQSLQLEQAEVDARKAEGMWECEKLTLTSATVSPSGAGAVVRVSNASMMNDIYPARESSSNSRSSNLPNRENWDASNGMPLSPEDARQIHGNPFSPSPFEFAGGDLGGSSSLFAGSPQLDSPVSRERRYSSLIRRGSYGWGLDLAKVPPADTYSETEKGRENANNVNVVADATTVSGKYEGGTQFLKFKVLPIGQKNLAQEAEPRLIAGDVIVALDGQEVSSFVETVRALRSCTSDSIQITFVRCA